MSAGTTPTLRIRQACLPADSTRLRAVIAEYITWLDMDLSARGFAQEMAAFDRLFTPPSGLFLMAVLGDDVADGVGAEVAGCVGLLRHDDHTAEVKRLYVRPAHRGLRLGEQLMTALVQRATGLGFARLILDAVPPTVVAQRLYRTLGFEETAPYYPAPVAGTRFFALVLKPTAV